MRTTHATPHRPGPRRSGGFTLTELLVVVAILVLLVGLVLAAMAPLRRAGLVTQDLSNLRQLAIAAANYATDHRGLLVDAQLPHGGGALLDESGSFVRLLEAYSDSPLLLRSPLDGSPHWPGGVALPGGRFRQTSYGLNNHLCREFSAWGAIDPGRITDRLSLVPNPAATVHFLLMTEQGAFAGADHVHVETWGDADTAPVVAASQAATAAAGGPPATSAARSNWAFLDGHVETTTFGALYRNADSNNFDPAVSGRVRLLLPAAAP